MKKLREVVLVDDSDPDLLFTEVVLQSASVAERILPFGTAAEALEFLQQPQGHQADVVLLDINMPEMNGFEFLDAYEALHQQQRARAVVVMLTSSSDPSDRERASAYSCVKGYLVKPIDAQGARWLLEVVGQIADQAG